MHRDLWSKTFQSLLLDLTDTSFPHKNRYTYPFFKWFSALHLVFYWLSNDIQHGQVSGKFQIPTCTPSALSGPIPEISPNDPKKFQNVLRGLSFILTLNLTPPTCGNFRDKNSRMQSTIFGFSCLKPSGIEIFLRCLHKSCSV